MRGARPLCRATTGANQARRMGLPLYRRRASPPCARGSGSTGGQRMPDPGAQAERRRRRCSEPNGALSASKRRTAESAPPLAPRHPTAHAPPATAPARVPAPQPMPRSRPRHSPRRARARTRAPGAPAPQPRPRPHAVWIRAHMQPFSRTRWCRSRPRPASHPAARPAPRPAPPDLDRPTVTRPRPRAPARPRATRLRPSRSRSRLRAPVRTALTRREPHPTSPPGDRSR
jgi:hypothetical protein